MTHEFKRTSDKLAIVGSHKTTRDSWAFNDPSWDLWVFNEAAQNEWVKRWTAVFNVHQEKNLMNTNGIGNINHWEWLQKDHGPDKTIWTQKVDERIPNSVAYPVEDMVKNWSPADPNGEGKGFFTSSPSYSLALGLYLGYTTIYTWGIDLGSNTEYTYQAPCYRYWVGVAKGMLGDNFKIINGGKPLFRAKLYGYEDDTRVGPDYYKKRVKFHDAYWATAKKRCEKIKNGLIDILSGKGEPKDFMPLFQQAIDAYSEYGKTTGAMGEAQRLSERAEILHRQEFEWHAAKAQEIGRKLQRDLWVNIGRLEYIFNVWAQTKHMDSRDQVIGFLDKATQLSYNLGFASGKSDENIFYLNEFDQRLTDASGGEVNDEVLAAQNTEIR